jgi:two-component system, response regulator PdtaR
MHDDMDMHDETDLAGGLRVLVCEDEAMVAAEVAGQLRELGHEVVGVISSGDEVIDAVKRLKPELVITDIRMPGRHGLAAAKQVYDELNVPVVVLSAYSDRREIQGAQEAGAFGYLVKPVMVEQLRATIDVAYDRFCKTAMDKSENAALQRRLEERKIIEQAKWVMVKKSGMSESEAYTQLQNRARAERVRMIDIAKLVVYEAA